MLISLSASATSREWPSPNDFPMKSESRTWYISAFQYCPSYTIIIILENKQQQHNNKKYLKEWKRNYFPFITGPNYASYSHRLYPLSLSSIKKERKSITPPSQRTQLHLAVVNVIPETYLEAAEIDNTQSNHTINTDYTNKGNSVTPTVN